MMQAPTGFHAASDAMKDLFEARMSALDLLKEGVAAR